MSKTKRKSGQPSKYPKINLKQVEKLAGYGLIDREVADILGIGRSTLSLYLVEHPEFLEALKKGKLKADIQVVKSLYKRAIGYQYDELHYERVKEGLAIGILEGEIKDIKSVPQHKIRIVTKEIAPDVTAQIYWTKNRRPQDWRDKQDIEHTFKKFLYTENDGKTKETIEEESLRIAEAIMEKRQGIKVSEET